jgi:hypothetical protein
VRVEDQFKGEPVVKHVCRRRPPASRRPVVRVEALEGRRLLTGAVSGYLYNDVNVNGQWDSADVPVGGQVFVDYDRDGALDPGEPQAQSTLANGFRIDGVTPGTWPVRQNLPSNWVQTFPATDPEVRFTSGLITIGLRFGARDLSASSSINVTVYEDVNANGARDSGEPAISGRTVYSDLNGNLAFDEGEPFAVSNAFGSAQVRVQPGTHNVYQVLPEGWAQTQPANAAPISHHFDRLYLGTLPQPMGSRKLTGTITGVVYDDWDGDGVKDSADLSIAGRTVYIDVDGNGELDAGEPQALTTASGFRFDDLQPGSYTLRQVTPEGWMATAPQGGTLTVDVGQMQTVIGKNFGQFKLGAISGLVYHDLNGNQRRDISERGLAGRLVWLDTIFNRQIDPGERSTLTDARGVFRFEGLSAGDVYVKLGDVPGWRSNAVPFRGRQIRSGGDYDDGDWAQGVTGLVRGEVAFDRNADGVDGSGDGGLAGQTVYADLNGDGQLQDDEPRNTTGVHGEFGLALAPGTYTLRVLLPEGYAMTGPAGGSIQVTVGAMTSTWVGTFLVHSARLDGAIIGTVFEDLDDNRKLSAGDMPLPGRRIYVDADDDGEFDPEERSAVSDESGFYWLNELPSGTYRLRQVVPAGWEPVTINSSGGFHQTGSLVHFASIDPSPAGPGDADDDGRLTPDDYFAIDRGRAQRRAGFENGDFDRSGGYADADDYMLIDRAFMSQNASRMGGSPLTPGPPAPPAHEHSWLEEDDDLLY